MHIKRVIYYLNKVDGEIDRLLAGSNVVGDDIRHKGLFWLPWIHLLLGKEIVQNDVSTKNSF